MAKSIGIFGESGSFKSTSLLFAAKYLYKKTGKILRVVQTSSSSGGMFDAFVKSGLMEVWRVSTLENPLPFVRKLAKGYWPQVTNRNGMNIIEMAPPTAATWEKVGGIAIDDMTTLCDVVMRDVVDKGRKIAEEVVSQFKESTLVVGKGMEEESFGAPARAHYGFLQNFVYGVINAMSALPVEIAIFTFLEAKAEEDDRTTIYGPAIVGKKATPKVPAWLGTLIHHDSVQIPKLMKGVDPMTGKPKDETVYETHVRAYFMRHPDIKTGINFPAKPRIVPDKWPELLRKWPGGYYEPTIEHGLDLFLEMEDELEGGATDALKEWREKIDLARKGEVAK